MKAILFISVSINLMLSGVFLLSHSVKKLEYHLYLKPYIEATANDLNAQIDEMKKKCEASPKYSRKGLMVKKEAPHKKDTI